MKGSLRRRLVPHRCRRPAGFEAFYAGQTAGGVEADEVLMGAVDCKGIPMVKPEGAARVVRRRKGEKANRKKMATAAAVFAQAPRVRTPAHDALEAGRQDRRQPAE